MKKDTCKHFNGIQYGKCNKNIEYEQFRIEGTSMLKTLPCFNREYTCVCFEAPTEEEIAAYNEEVSNTMRVIDEIMCEIQNGIHTGVIVCTCGGTITYSSNGSNAIRGRCDSCNLSFIS